MTWWQQFLAWLGLSEPGNRKEQAEDALEANAERLQKIYDRCTAFRAAHGRFPQMLRGTLARPSDQGEPVEVEDQAERDDLKGRLPAWLELELNQYEAPPPRSHGYELALYVTELDASVWRLGIDSQDGPTGWVRLNPIT